MTTNAELTERFKHHPPKTDQRISTHEAVREAATELATKLNDILPESREKSLALTAVQEAAMWSNAAVAIHEQG